MKCKCVYAHKADVIKTVVWCHVCCLLYLVFWVVDHWRLPLSIHFIIPVIWFLGIGIWNVLWLVPVLRFWILWIIDVLAFIPIVWLLRIRILYQLIDEKCETNTPNNEHRTQSFKYSITFYCYRYDIESKRISCSERQGSHSFTEKKIQDFPGPQEKFSRTFTEPTNAYI